MACARILRSLTEIGSRKTRGWVDNTNLGGDADNGGVWDLRVFTYSVICSNGEHGASSRRR